MKKVLVASKNPCKVEACRKAFERVRKGWGELLK